MDHLMDRQKAARVSRVVMGCLKHVPRISFISSTHHPTEALMQNVEPQGSNSNSGGSELNCGSM